MHTKAPTTPVEIEPLLTAQQVADFLSVTLPAVYLAVNAKRLPAPYYPLSRTPRWKLSEINAALERTRALPAEARAGRRQARLDREGGETSPPPASTSDQVPMPEVKASATVKKSREKHGEAKRKSSEVKHSQVQQREAAEKSAASGAAPDAA